MAIVARYYGQFPAKQLRIRVIVARRQSCSTWNDVWHVRAVHPLAARSRRHCRRVAQRLGARARDGASRVTRSRRRSPVAHGRTVDICRRHRARARRRASRPSACGAEQVRSMPNGLPGRATRVSITLTPGAARTGAERCSACWPMSRSARRRRTAWACAMPCAPSCDQSGGVAFDVPIDRVLKVGDEATARRCCRISTRR